MGIALSRSTSFPPAPAVRNARIQPCPRAPHGGAQEHLERAASSGVLAAGARLVRKERKGARGRCHHEEVTREVALGGRETGIVGWPEEGGRAGVEASTVGRTNQPEPTETDQKWG